MEIIGDFSTSVEKAFSEIDPKYRDYLGYVICGTHAPSDIDEQLKIIENCRISGTPFLGICFGHQLAAIEYAQNVLREEKATSEEFHTYEDLKYLNLVVVKNKDGLKVGLGKDGESYWHNYHVIEGFEDLWKKADNFITCQYHPEYQSSKEKPHPLLVKFMNYAKMAV